MKHTKQIILFKKKKKLLRLFTVREFITVKFAYITKIRFILTLCVVLLIHTQMYHFIDLLFLTGYM